MKFLRQRVHDRQVLDIARGKPWKRQTMAESLLRIGETMELWARETGI